MLKRTLIAGVLAASLLLAACGGAGSGGSAQDDSAQSGPEGKKCDIQNPPLFEDGTLTVATDRPAYPPWFEGSPKDYSGFEGEVASEIAKRMGLPIKWVVEPFNKSYAPGAKDYDFDVNQITITPERERVVDFSDGYFDNSQGVLVMEDSPAAGAKSLADLKDVRIGAQVGTTSLKFVNETIQPDEEPKVYNEPNDAKSALEAGQIDAFVTDLVTTVYLRDVEIEGSEVIGKYPSEEQFGALFEKDNPLVDCVNEVLGEMESDGTLKKLEKKFLQDYLSVPTFKE